MNEPDNYRELQLEWCDSQDRSDDSPLNASARIRASRVCDWLAGVVGVGPVLCVGPRYGTEMFTFMNLSADVVMGIEPVAKFAEICREDGLTIIEEPVEDTVLDLPWNVYASHSLEHCYDRTLAIENLKQCCKDWFYLESPVEPGEVKDRAHLSPFRTIEEIRAHFPGWDVIAEKITKPNARGNRNAAILFRKPQ